MTRKSSAVAALVADFEGQRMDARYLAYFHSFNQQRFYEAHDLLEDLWLPDRNGPDGAFYKGLIQLAGAFVLLQKNRLRPADRVFELAETNLRPYPDRHQSIELGGVRAIVASWRQKLQSENFTVNPLGTAAPPDLIGPDDHNAPRTRDSGG
ncbi:MAG: DUF309 domain-containing protein [Opitutaceae bacterium]|nr:DUF309 domain-containing protein [Opitutaceae bacterium]